MSRRTALGVGATAAGLTAGSGIGSQVHAVPFTVKESDYLYPWSPPEDVLDRRNLTPGNTAIRLSCTDHGLQYEPGIDMETSVRAVLEAGYTAAEGSESWKQASDSEIRDLKTVLREHDLMFYTLHMCINNIHPDPAERQKNLKRVAELVAAADRLGLDFIVSHTGSCFPGAATIPHRDNWSAKTWKTSVELMKQILRDTAGSHVSLGIEAINVCNINNPRAHIKLREDVGDPRIKVTLDPQNMLNITTYYRSTELVNECFDLFGEDICYAHCKDVKIRDEMLPSFEWVVVGTGTMDYETYLVRLSRLMRTRVLMLEFLPSEKYPEAKRYVEETAKKLGVRIYS